MDFNNLLKLIFGRIGKTRNNVTISNATETAILAAGATGVYRDLYNLIISNTSATDVVVTIRDKTAGTARFVISVKAGDTRGFALPSQDAHKQNEAAQAWTAQSSAVVSNIEIACAAVERS